jgi:hypothetical protein
MSQSLMTTEKMSPPEGRFVQSRGRRVYEIERVDAMPPFLMTVVGDTDLWMFLSSAGAFTAGRVESDRCLFPYETDDRLHELGGLSGPVTMVRFADGRLWRPLWSPPGASGVGRTLRRSLIGDLVEFEEIDEQTGLTFRAELTLSDKYGVVRRCELACPAEGAPVECEIVDGYVNIMPACVPLGLQQSMSTLVDGYKRAELVSERGPAIYTLESVISDRPEAVECLRANTVWHVGLEDGTVSLDEGTLAAFTRGETHADPTPVLGRRGAYLCRASLRIVPGNSERWCIVGDVHLDHGAIARVRQELEPGTGLADRIERSLREDRERLEALLDGADAAQATEDTGACAAHRSNVLFNAMRGGVPLDGYAVETGAFRRFVRCRHRAVASRHDAWLASLATPARVGDLPSLARATGDGQLERLAYEYLPLTFGRRHGDPSRPWNRFRIQVRDMNGSRTAGYEGNWRDIFQNWEAMCRSYPEMLPGVIAKFVNASTVDGYNPYRVNEHGIDWEVPEPHNVRSNIGYWGDHQIVYLLRLLEQCRDTLPDRLGAMLEAPVFSYANVPYRLRPFDEIVANPRASILFDEALHRRLGELSREMGDDARLVLGGSGEPALVTLVEKLLVTALAKASNLVPGGGIWMNTLRPEWNDANNALAGTGLSMVTLFHLRRFCEFSLRLIETLGEGHTALSAPVARWCEAMAAAVARVLDEGKPSGGWDDAARWRAMRAFGLAAQAARESMYAGGTGESVRIDRMAVASFFDRVLALCDRTIAGAKRPDGLVESYNVLHLRGSSAEVEPLGAMLEGQVAALSSGVLDADEACGLLDALFRSELYRADQRSFMLYPRVDLPSFMDRNVIDREDLAGSPLLQRAIDEPAAGLAARDADGVVRFNADLGSHEALAARLDALAARPGWADLVRAHADGVHRAFERTFRHAQFTGRSGRMHKYEGLGSIYWHMVSKLLLATQECVFQAVDAQADSALIGRLCGHFAAIRDGLGFRKSPGEFGAVPHDPYSHTPWGSGAQQPGMTGQVKEGVLARFGELGVRVRRGRIEFDPVLLDPAERLTTAATMRVRGGLPREIEVPAGAVGLTLCGTPIVVTPAGRSRITVHLEDGSRLAFDGAALPVEWSREVFARSGRVARIEAETGPAL